MASFAGPNLTTDNLLLCLDAGDSNSYPGSGTTWNDVSGMDIHGTINSATYTSDADGKYFAFDGTDDYISFAMGGGRPLPLRLATWSTECWFKQASGGSTSNTGSGGQVYYPLVTKGMGEADGSNLDMNYGMGIRTDGKIGADFEQTGNGFNRPVTSNGTVSLNTWNHLLVSYNGTTWGVYINGILDKTSAKNVSARSDSIQHNAIGTSMNSSGARGGYFSGKIAIARIYGRALSYAEVRNNYNSHKGRFGL